MEFFEKAHVMKKESSRKDHKSGETLKKHLKQLLQGYKRSDRNLIKRCNEEFDPDKFNEDSSSVSGFSDLNLTGSSYEMDTTHGTLGSDWDDKHNSISDEISFSKLLDSSNDELISNLSSLNSQQSTSNIEDNLKDNFSELLSSDNLSVHNISLSEVTTISDSNDSESFDADGVLATRILEKLSKMEVEKKKAKKRKFRHNTSECSYTQSSDNEVNLDVDDKVDINESVSDSNSSDFISVKVNYTENQSLSEILGKYTFSTIRSLLEVQNMDPTNNLGLFSVEDLVSNIDIQEEIRSLSPECNSSVNSEFVNFSLIDPDASIIPSTTGASINDDTSQTEDISEREITMDSVDSNVEVPFKFYYGKDKCIFVLKHPAELYIHGKVKAKVLGGTMEILGYTLQSNEYDIYAPNYNLAHCLKTVMNDNIYNGLFSKLTAQGLSVAETEEIVTHLGEYDGVICLSKLSSHALNFVENNMKPTDLFSKQCKNVDFFLRKASEILGCSLYSQKPHKVFEEFPVTKPVIDCGMAPQSKGIICGGKGVGKSTFLRYSVNRLLHQGPVLVLDLDPGQAEFTVAGHISATVVDAPLLGPNFTHLKTPIKMLNLGMINTMDNPRRYATAVNILINYCYDNEQLKSMPWVINTMGLCNAIGLRFIILTILLIRPTYLLQIDCKNTKKKFETLLSPFEVHKLYRKFERDPLLRHVRCENIEYSFFVANHTDGAVKSYSLAPRDERYLNFLAYFGEHMSSLTSNLLEIRPYEVRLDDLCIVLNVRIEDAVHKVINGKIVALCQITPYDKRSKVLTLRDKPLLCHGHGLIRGVDFDKKLLYITTPLSVDRLSLVNTLLYADWVPELRGLERQLPDGVPVPYRSATMYQKRQLMFTPKRRFNPLQLIKMTRNS